MVLWHAKYDFLSPLFWSIIRFVVSTREIAQNKNSRNRQTQLRRGRNRVFQVWYIEELLTFKSFTTTSLHRYPGEGWSHGSLKRKWATSCKHVCAGAYEQSVHTCDRFIALLHCCQWVSFFFFDYVHQVEFCCRLSWEFNGVTCLDALGQTSIACFDDWVAFEDFREECWCRINMASPAVIYG